MRKLVLLFCLILFAGLVYARTKIGGDAWIITSKDTDGTTTYEGYQTNYSDEWYIVKYTTETWLYNRGASNYDVNWSTRTYKTYYQPNNGNVR